jgi:hypothetical protein
MAYRQKTAQPLGKPLKTERANIPLDEMPAPMR